MAEKKYLTRTFSETTGYYNAPFSETLNNIVTGTGRQNKVGYQVMGSSLELGLWFDWFDTASATGRLIIGIWKDGNRDGPNIYSEIFVENSSVSPTATRIVDLYSKENRAKWIKLLDRRITPPTGRNAQQSTSLVTRIRCPYKMTYSQDASYTMLTTRNNLFMIFLTDQATNPTCTFRGTVRFNFTDI